MSEHSRRIDLFEQRLLIVDNEISAMKDDKVSTEKHDSENAQTTDSNIIEIRRNDKFSDIYQKEIDAF